jgi:hypothetical protein
MLSREKTQSMSKQKGSPRAALVLQMMKCLLEHGQVWRVAGSMLGLAELFQDRCPSDAESLLSHVSLRSLKTLPGHWLAVGLVSMRKVSCGRSGNLLVAA